MCGLGQDLGFPCHRPRLYVLGIAKDKMVWIPPPNGGDEAERFLGMLGAETNSYGDCYMMDSWSSRRSQLSERMKLRQLHLGAGALLEEPADRTERFQYLCCPPDATPPLQGHMSRFARSDRARRWTCLSFVTGSRMRPLENALHRPLCLAC